MRHSAYVIPTYVRLNGRISTCTIRAGVSEGATRSSTNWVCALEYRVFGIERKKTKCSVEITSFFFFCSISSTMIPFRYPSKNIEAKPFDIWRYAAEALLLLLLFVPVYCTVQYWRRLSHHHGAVPQSCFPPLPLANRHQRGGIRQLLWLDDGGWAKFQLIGGLSRPFGVKLLVGTVVACW